MNKIKQIFKEIEEAVVKYRSPYPVTIEDSNFLKELKKIKEKWLKKEE